MPLHALVLRLPAALCAQRAAERTDHEGRVEGKGSASVVCRMHGQLEKAGEWTGGMIIH